MDPRYRTSDGCVFFLKYHLVWCPKYRLKILSGPVEKDLKALLHVKARELKIRIEALEIMPDHVHLFVSSDPTEAPQRIANQFKGYTSRILRKKYTHLRTRLPCLWSRSYYVGSVGIVSERTVKRYIEQQKER